MRASLCLSIHPSAHRPMVSEEGGKRMKRLRGREKGTEVHFSKLVSSSQNGFNVTFNVIATSFIRQKPQRTSSKKLEIFTQSVGGTQCIAKSLILLEPIMKYKSYDSGYRKYTFWALICSFAQQYSLFGSKDMIKTS